MDVNKILDELRQEYDLLQHTIDTLERLARGQGKRRGRPPAWLKEPTRRRSGGLSRSRSFECAGLSAVGAQAIRNTS